MGRPSPFPIELLEAERTELERRVRTHTAEPRQVVRARIVLMAADGDENVAIAEALGVAPKHGLQVAQAVLRGGPSTVWPIGLVPVARSSSRPQVRAEEKAVACP